jgi:hypothetical protein
VQLAREHQYHEAELNAELSDDLRTGIQLRQKHSEASGHDELIEDTLSEYISVDYE